MTRTIKSLLSNNRLVRTPWTAHNVSCHCLSHRRTSGPLCNCTVKKSGQMELSRSEKVSGDSCQKCGGSTRWFLELNFRNILVLVLHFLASLVGLFLIIILSTNNILETLVLFAAFGLILYVFRRAYKTTLKCESCGNVVKHRDIFYFRTKSN